MPETTTPNVSADTTSAQKEDTNVVQQKSKKQPELLVFDFFGNDNNGKSAQVEKKSDAPEISLQERFARYRKFKVQERKAVLGHKKVEKKLEKNKPVKSEKTEQRILSPTDEAIVNETKGKLAAAMKNYGTQNTDSGNLDPNIWETPLRQLWLSELKTFLGRKYDDVDCSGLLKFATRNMYEKKLISWFLGERNQSYQFCLAQNLIGIWDCTEDSTKTKFAAGNIEKDLPDLISKQLKPGDLIFYEASFKPNAKRKPQPLDIVHVEVYLGPGKQTIGSRNRKTNVTELDSFAFESLIWDVKKVYFFDMGAWLLPGERFFSTNITNSTADEQHNTTDDQSGSLFDEFYTHRKKLPEFREDVKEKAEKLFPIMEKVSGKSVFFDDCN